jgi:peptide deformylase
VGYHPGRRAALDRDGKQYDLELSGWPARIAQHEVDHLNGVLYLDRAELRSLSTMPVYERNWTQLTPAEAAAALTFPI